MYFSSGFKGKKITTKMRTMYQALKCKLWHLPHFLSPLPPHPFGGRKRGFLVESQPKNLEGLRTITACTATGGYSCCFSSPGPSCPRWTSSGPGGASAAGASKQGRGQGLTKIALTRKRPKHSENSSFTAFFQFIPNHEKNTHSVNLAGKE